MPNKWIMHVKEYCSKTGLKYRDALKDPACKSSYKSGSPSYNRYDVEHLKEVFKEKTKDCKNKNDNQNNSILRD
jgi:hypothetical protein